MLNWSSPWSGRLQLQTQTPFPCRSWMALDVGTATLTFYLILDFVFMSLISPVGNKGSEAFLDIVLKNDQWMFIVTDEKLKSCTPSSPLDICPGSVLNLSLDSHVITKLLSESSVVSLCFSKSPKHSKLNIRTSSWGKHFNIGRERLGNFWRGVRKWELIHFDLKDKKVTEGLGLIFLTLPSLSTPRNPAVPPKHHNPFPCTWHKYKTHIQMHLN